MQIFPSRRKDGTPFKSDDKRRILIGAKLKLQMKGFRHGSVAMKYKVAQLNMQS